MLHVVKKDKINNFQCIHSKRKHQAIYQSQSLNMLNTNALSLHWILALLGDPWKG